MKTLPQIDFVVAAAAWGALVGLRAPSIVPYRPGHAEWRRSVLPTTPDALAGFFASKFAPPQRVTGNAVSGDPAYRN